jgi:hypothetical protein
MLTSPMFAPPNFVHAPTPPANLVKLRNERPNLIPKLTVIIHLLQVGEHSGKESGDGEYVRNVGERGI